MLFLTINVEPYVPCSWVAVKQLSFPVPRVGRDTVIICIWGKIPLFLAPWQVLTPIFHSPDVWVISHGHLEALCQGSRILAMKFSTWI